MPKFERDKPHRFDKELQRIGAKIRQHRLEAGLTQTQLSASTGITQPSISAIENGQIDVQVVTLMRIAASIGVDLVNFVD